MVRGQLVSLSTGHVNALGALLREFEESGDELHGYFFNRSMSIKQVVSTLKAWERGDELPDGWVPNSTWFWENDEVLQGVINVRHYLSPWLEKNGGHIGYSVAPSQRQQGVATSMLKSALIKCKELGIPRAMVICESGNVGSVKAIEANNGVLEREENGRRWYMIGVSEDVLWPPTTELTGKSDEAQDEKKKPFGFDNSENASVLYRQLGIQVEKDNPE